VPSSAKYPNLTRSWSNTVSFYDRFLPALERV
jgi:hypothetical protein